MEIKIERVKISERKKLENLLQLYLHDLSLYFPIEFNSKTCKYEYDLNKYFENDLYWKEHINRQLSIDMWIDEYKSYFNNKGICLELGCGIGQYSKRLIEYGYKVISTDISDIALNEVKKFNQNVEKVDMSMPLKYDNNSFDLVFSSLAIHYFSEEKTAQLMSEIHRVLKNGGLFVGSVNGLEGYDVIKDTAIRLEENFYFNKGKYVSIYLLHLNLQLHSNLWEYH